MNPRRPQNAGLSKNTASSQQQNTLQTRHILSGSTATIPTGPCNIAGRLTSTAATNIPTHQQREVLKNNTLRQPLGRIQTNVRQNNHVTFQTSQKPTKIPQFTANSSNRQLQQFRTLPPPALTTTYRSPRPSSPEDDSDFHDARQPLFISFEDSKLETLPSGVTDIDAARTEENGGMDCVTESFFYMLYKEQERPISMEFPYTIPGQEAMRPAQQTRSLRLVDERMRLILVDWIIQCAIKLNLRKLTTYLGIWILDKFIDECNSPSRRKAALRNMGSTVDSSVRNNLMPIYVNKQNLQLVGVTAMVIATKYEEIHFPILEDWVYLSADSVQRAQIIEMEIRILRALDFDVCQPSPIEFLRRFSKVAQSDQRTHIIAKFCIETSLYSTELSKIPGSIKAAASLFIAMHLSGSTRRAYWTDDLSFYSQLDEKHNKMFNKTISLIAAWLIRTVSDSLSKGPTKKGKATAVYKKYSSQENQHVATEPGLFGSRLSRVSKLLPGESVTDRHITVLQTGHVIRINPTLQQFADGRFKLVNLKPRET